MKPLSIEDLDACFERVIEVAKGLLLRDGTLGPVAILLTDRLPEAASKEVEPLDFGFGIVLPLPWAEPTGVVWLFAQCGPKPRAMVEAAMEEAKKIGLSPDEAARSFAAALERAVGEPKDIAAAYIRRRIEETGGVYAVIQVHEVWTARSYGGQRPPGPVSDMPGRREAVLALLEAKGQSRMTVIPFDREGGREDDSSAKVTGFGPRVDSRGQFEGRFAGLLGEVH